MLAIQGIERFYIYQPLKLLVVLCNISVWIEGSKGECWRGFLGTILALRRRLPIRKGRFSYPSDVYTLPCFPDVAFRFNPDGGGMPRPNFMAMEAI